VREVVKNRAISHQRTSLTAFAPPPQILGILISHQRTSLTAFAPPPQILGILVSGASAPCRPLVTETSFENSRCRLDRLPIP